MNGLAKFPYSELLKFQVTEKDWETIPEILSLMREYPEKKIRKLNKTASKFKTIEEITDPELLEFLENL